MFLLLCYHGKVFPHSKYRMILLLAYGISEQDQNVTCGTPDYPRVLHDEDSAFSATITEKGILKFIRCGVESATIFAMQIPFPDIIVPINLGFTSIEFSLKDLVFSDFTVGKIDASLEEGVPVQAGIEDTNVHLKFVWEYQEMKLPYSHDAGSGEILLNGIMAKFLINTGCDYDKCPGHLLIDLKQATLTFDQLTVRLEGGQSWIYQSMINLLIDAIKQPLCNMISELMLTGATKLMNDMMTSSGYYWPYDNFPNVIKDDRFVGALDVHKGFMTILFSGYTYQADQLQDEYIKPSMLQDITYNFLNYELGFQIKKPGFDNAFYIFHKYYDAYSQEGIIKLLQAPSVEFFNEAALIHILGIIPNIETPVKFAFKADPIWRTDKIADPQTGYRNVTQVYFTLKPYQASQKVANEQVNTIIMHLNNVFEYANYQIDTTPFMIMENFHYIIDSKEQVLRLFDNVPEECPKL